VPERVDVWAQTPSDAIPCHEEGHANHNVPPGPEGCCPRPPFPPPLPPPSPPPPRPPAAPSLGRPGAHGAPLPKILDLGPELHLANLLELSP